MSAPEGDDEVRNPGPDGKYHCRKCGKELTPSKGALILWD
jgi:hypothetical protein